MLKRQDPGRAFTANLLRIAQALKKQKQKNVKDKRSNKYLNIIASNILIMYISVYQSFLDVPCHVSPANIEKINTKYFLQTKKNKYELGNFKVK